LDIWHAIDDLNDTSPDARRRAEWALLRCGPYLMHELVTARAKIAMAGKKDNKRPIISSRAANRLLLSLLLLLCLFSTLTLDSIHSVPQNLVLLFFVVCLTLRGRQLKKTENEEDEWLRRKANVELLWEQGLQERRNTGVILEIYNARELRKKDPTNSQTSEDCRKALITLLPHLGQRKRTVLSPLIVSRIHRLLRDGNEALVLSALTALADVGDIRSLKAVKILMEREESGVVENQAVYEAAATCLRRLESRLTAEHGSRTLLHPAEAPPTADLLRPAGTRDQDTEILLRTPEP
jgi:hypothetical protein